ncbi:MAG: peptide chain release factor N(5)-glutamine methyltransferase, partial [Burkholderiales bacterium]
MKVRDALAGCGLEPREARLLLAEATGFSVASVLAHAERDVPAPANAMFADWAARRRAGEPIAYLLGRREFYGLMLGVTPAVLIPRPETELLVDRALAQLSDNDQASVADLGTGSGAAALAIKRHRPRVRVVATEISAEALEVAGRNAARLSLSIELRQGRWFEPLAGERFDLVVSNPPYVAQEDPHLARGDLRFEPRSALSAGPDGLEALRAIVAEAPAHLRPGGWLLLEHGLGQDVPVRENLAHEGFEGVYSWPDLAGIARVTG